MRRSYWLMMGLLGVFVIVAGAAFASGFGPSFGSKDSARPPCDQLPRIEDVVDAIASHEDLADRLRDVGPDVTVEAAAPCKDDPEKGIVRVTYGTDEEREGIHEILKNADGFGAPVEVVGI